MGQDPNELIRKNRHGIMLHQRFHQMRSLVGYALFLHQLEQETSLCSPRVVHLFIPRAWLRGDIRAIVQHEFDAIVIDGRVWRVLG